MTRDELIDLLRRLVEAAPEDEGGCCRHCHRWTGTDPADRHDEDCPYRLAVALVHGAAPGRSDDPTSGGADRVAGRITPSEATFGPR